MLELDECSQILVTNPFADESPTISSNTNHDALATSASEHHPLRSRAVSSTRCCNMPRVTSVDMISSGGETRPRLTSMLSLDGLSAEVAAEEDQITASEAPHGGSDVIIHPIGPNDSFAGVALRYGVSIAALRRANQLWPSDPIHLRTELFIPRGDTLRVRPVHGASTGTTLPPIVESTPNLTPDLVASSFVAARNMVLSMLPARISIDSLSSKASASEDHELDDFQNARAHKMSITETTFTEQGHELSLLSTPRAQHKWPGIPLSSQVPCSPTNKHLDDHHIPPVGSLHSRSISSPPTASLRQSSRAQPFSVLSVRTSQLEPEPAMELPVRRSRI